MEMRHLSETTDLFVSPGGAVPLSLAAWSELTSLLGGMDSRSVRAPGHRAHGNSILDHFGVWLTFCPCCDAPAGVDDNEYKERTIEHRVGRHKASSCSVDPQSRGRIRGYYCSLLTLRIRGAYAFFICLFGHFMSYATTGSRIPNANIISI